MRQAQSVPGRGAVFLERLRPFFYKDIKIKQAPDGASFILMGPTGYANPRDCFEILTVGDSGLEPERLF